jgi:hypothetical protein
MKVLVLGVIGKPHCIGQTYNLVNRGFITWEQYHRTAMKLLSREVELVGISLKTLLSMDTERFSICNEIFAHNVYYSADKLFRDVPEFQPTVSLEEGMRQVFEQMEVDGKIPNADLETWEDQIIGSYKIAFP